MLIRPLDRSALRRQYSAGNPFPFVVIDDFLDSQFAKAIAEAYPSFEEGQQIGYTYDVLNQRRKVQISDPRSFPEPVARLNEAISSADFLTDLSSITGIKDLVPDNINMEGGGMHISGPGGRLDVHIDFNYLEKTALHRRLNLLLYLNPIWQREWGGHLQLWNEDVRECRQTVVPALNRCVVFETSEISYHGVTPISPHAPCARISFAAFFYTREAPADWRGSMHNSVYKARPNERLRKYILIPARALKGKLAQWCSYD